MFIPGTAAPSLSSPEVRSVIKKTQTLTPCSQLKRVHSLGGVQKKVYLNRGHFSLSAEWEFMTSAHLDPLSANRGTRSRLSEVFPLRSRISLLREPSGRMNAWQAPEKTKRGLMSIIIAAIIIIITIIIAIMCINQPFWNQTV